MRFRRIAALGSVAAMALALASIATSPTLAEINGMKAHAEKTVTEADGNPLTIWDSNGNRSNITIRNVFQSNGVIHVIDSVLLPI